MSSSTSGPRPTAPCPSGPHSSPAATTRSPASQAPSGWPAPDGALPFRSTLVASRNDPFACFASSERMARAWGSQLVDCGNAGHINADSGLGYWTTGVSLLTRLMERNDGLPVRNWLLRSA